MTTSGSSSHDILRQDILAVGVDDFVSMADVIQLIDDGGLADSAAELQQLVGDTVRSLLDDGLVEVGGLPSPSSPGFKTWPGKVDEVMTRFTDRFVAHYDDRYEWAYKVWLNLTAEGREVSAAFEDES
jgi:hypothetical protein